MEKKKTGYVIDRSVDIDTLSFKIKVSEETIYNVTNCHSVTTDTDAMKNGVECYFGNVELNDNNTINNVSACLWVYPDNNCVVVYNDC